MCGILGIISEKEYANVLSFRESLNTLEHRGPDGSGIYISNDRKTILGFRRLAIIDLSDKANQPMHSENKKKCLVCNGEVYNFQELRRELEKNGHIFKSASDSEVILHAYEQWQEDCVYKLRGMFAFAIWDEGEKTLFIARDRVGIKPLFYYYDGKNFIFGSEINAILAYPEVIKEIDTTALYDFLTYKYIPAPKTIYTHIKKLLPAHLLIFRNSFVQIKEYWDIPYSDGNRPGKNFGEREAVERAKELLNEAIGLHLISDVPLGVFLSGGIDSTTVNYFAIQNSYSKLDSFSIGFDVKEHSELNYAETAANFLNGRHYEQNVTKQAMEEVKDFVIDTYNEPYGDGSAVPTYFLSKMTRRHVKVALSGDGGDELFWGYKWYSEFLNRENSRKNANKGDNVDEDIEFYAFCMGAFLKEEKKGIFTPDFLKLFEDYDDYWYFRKYWKKDSPLVTRLQYLDFKTYLPDDILTKVDRASMAVSLEVRVPLLDHKLIEFIFSLPWEIRNKNFERKYLLKQIVKGLIPQEIINRPKKGFSAPYLFWLGDSIPEFSKNNITLPQPKMKTLKGSKRWALEVLNCWFRKMSI